ncbi:hypothetical protein ACHAXS_000200 [Conticribra weissflogii]
MQLIASTSPLSFKRKTKSTTPSASWHLGTQSFARFANGQLWSNGFASTRESQMTRQSILSWFLGASGESHLTTWWTRSAMRPRSSARIV